MPSIAHLFLGGIFGVFLYYISDKKFSKHHVFILFLNNYFGPDTGWAVGLGYYTHSIVGWMVYAFLLAWFYYYFTRFTLKIDGIRNVELIELDKPRLNYLNVYCLTAAGGIMHNYLDGMMNSGGNFRIIPSILSINPEISMSLNDFMAFWTEGALLQPNVALFLVLGIIFILGTIYVFVWFFKKRDMWVILYLIAWVSLFSLLFYLGGSVVTAEHSDVGALMFVSIFWLTPLGLCALSIKPITIRERKRADRSKRENKNLIAITAWLFFTGLVGIVAMSFVMYYSETIANIIIDYVGDVVLEYVKYPELILSLNIIALVLMSISGFNLFCALGLSLKKEPIWKLTVYYHLLLAWSIIGLVIACALSENAVKDEFRTIK